MTDEAIDATLPKAVWNGTFRVFGVDLACHVLSDGQRIIEEESFKRLMAAMHDVGMAGLAHKDAGDLSAFSRWRAGLEP